MKDVNFESLHNKLKELKLNAFLITHPINIKYLTDFSTLDGALLITEKDKFFFTSFCELEEAKNKLISFKVIERKQGEWNCLKDYIKKIKIKTLGFEEEYISYATLKLFKKASLNCRLKGTTGLIEELRVVKTQREIDKIKNAIFITEKVFNQLKRILKQGLMELDMLKHLSILIAKSGCKPAFEPIVAFGSHSAYPHAVSGKRRLKNDDLLLVDLGVNFEGYKSDLTRTFIMGQPKQKQIKIYNLVLEAQEFIQRLIKPWIPIAEIEKKAHQFFAKRGWGKYFPHSVGHGIGLEVHERPFFSNKSKGKLMPGMVFSLEPALYLPGWGGVRIEDLYLITNKSYQKLTTSAKP